MEKLAFIVLKPKKGKTEELIALLRRSIVVLQTLNVATQKDQILAMSADGSIIQIFEWATEDTQDNVAEHEEVRELWAEAEKMCEFLKPASVKEFQEVFPSFDIIS